MKTIKVKGYLLKYSIDNEECKMKVKYKKDVIEIATKLSKSYGKCIVRRIIENENNSLDIDNNFLELYENGYGRKLKW